MSSCHTEIPEVPCENQLLRPKDLDCTSIFGLDLSRFSPQHLPPRLESLATWRFVDDESGH